MRGIGGGRTGALGARSRFLAALGMTISFRNYQREAKAKAKAKARAKAKAKARATARARAKAKEEADSQRE